MGMIMTRGTMMISCIKLTQTIQVTYKVVGFLDKNSDLLFRDLSKVMFSSSSKNLKILFPDGLFVNDSLNQHYQSIE